MSVVVSSGLLLTVAVGLAQRAELAPGEGREVVETVCTACHTVDNITASHMSRKAWDTTISWMQDAQGLGPLEPDVREAILDYLEATQGLDARASDSAESPWAAPSYRPNPIW